MADRNCPSCGTRRIPVVCKNHLARHLRISLAQGLTTQATKLCCERCGLGCRDKDICHDLHSYIWGECLYCVIENGCIYASIDSPDELIGRILILLKLIKTEKTIGMDLFIPTKIHDNMSNLYFLYKGDREEVVNPLFVE